MTRIDETLAQRGNNYGNFAEQSRITQAIKAAMRDSGNWEALSVDKKEALEMLAVKVSRVLNGDPEYLDSWHDMIGYLRLVEQRIEVRAALKAVSDRGDEA